MLTAFVHWPSAPLTESLVRKAIASLNISVQIVSSISQLSPNSPVVQWSSYDELEHEFTKHDSVLQSSYIIRKNLIRKHFLSRCILSYTTKHPESVLNRSWPRTYDIEISFADELDELFADELWELGNEFQAGKKWWILKPLSAGFCHWFIILFTRIFGRGMADRGNGIRIFNDRETLQNILEEFEEQEDETDDEEKETTAVLISQLRHFVIQEYMLNPLLLDPREVPVHSDYDAPISNMLRGHKFHLRAYCVASGALTLYLYNHVLALFSSVPYTTPDSQASHTDIAPHLTNTSLQAHRGEEGVRLLDELVGCHILSTPTDPTGRENRILTSEDVSAIKDRISIVLAEAFKAALESPINFQALPNAFELFGVDFLVTDDYVGTSGFDVKLLEINAEPAIELTGPRLAWILEDLFVDIAKICVEPFFESSSETGAMPQDWPVGKACRNLVKCLDTQVRRNF